MRAISISQFPYCILHVEAALRRDISHQSRHKAAPTKKPKMKAFLIFHTLSFILLPFGALAAPNILLIVSEDNGQELGCYGEPYVQTPVLDNLATEGVLFKNAYVAQAGCSQSRPFSRVFILTKTDRLVWLLGNFACTMRIPRIL